MSRALSCLLLASVLTLFVPTLFVGCTGDLDRAKEVTDLRVLAIQADPPEVMLENLIPEDPAQPYALAYPLVDEVRFRVLAVDPRGYPMDFTWTLCPVESNIACLDYEDILGGTLETVTGLSPDLDALTELVRGSMNNLRATNTVVSPAPACPPASVPEAEPCDRTQSPPFAQPPPGGVPEYPVPEFSITLGDSAGGTVPFDTLSLMFFHLAQTQFGLLQGAWPSVTLDVSGGGQDLKVQKRLVLNVGVPGDLGNYLQRIGEEFTGDPTTIPIGPEEFLGFGICPTPPTPQPDGCLPLAPRRPNQNPVFSDIQIAPGESALDARFESVQVQPIQLAAGASMRILPVFTEDSFESYESVRFDLESRDLFVSQETEQIAVSWYSTAGEAEDATTIPRTTLTLDTVFAAPEEVPDRIVTLWIVARDQRGGTAWERLLIEILPPPPEP